MAVTTAAQRILHASAIDGASDEASAQLWSLIDQYRGILINQAYAILGQLEDAEEVVQETFCDAFRERSQMATVDSVCAWLRSINRANALSFLRSKKRSVRREDRVRKESRQATTGGFSALLLRESVARAIEQLPEDLRHAVVLLYWEHLRLEEIAERLGLSSRTVRRRIQRAYLLLYDRLNPCLESPTGEKEATP